MKYCILIVIVLLACSQAGDAAYWKYMDTLGNDIIYQIYYIDTETVERNGDIVRAWIKTDYKGENVIVDYGIGLSEVDCKGKRHRVIQGTDYWPDGSVAASMGQGPWQPIIPSLKAEDKSFGEMMLENLCP